MNKIQNYEKLREYCDEIEDFDIYDYAYYLGITSIENDIPESNIIDLIKICSEVSNNYSDPIEIGKSLAESIYHFKYLTLEQLKRIPANDIYDMYFDNKLYNLEYYFDSVEENITSIKDIKNGESYTVARVMDNGYCAELHYCSDTGATIEYTEKTTSETWDGTVEEIDWFNTKLTDDYVLKRLICLFEEKYLNKEIPEGKEKELNLIDHILNRHKVYDITLDLIYDDNILVAYDDQNIWTGKEFYDFMFNELFVYNNEDKVDLINDEDFNQLKKYKEQYEEKTQKKDEIEMEMG